jgi:hypothetical protein
LASERHCRQEAGVTAATAGAFTLQYQPFCSRSLSWSSSHLPRARAPLPRLGIDVNVGADISALAFALALRPGGRATCDLRDAGIPCLCATILVAAFGFVEGWTCTLGAATRAGARAWFLVGSRARVLWQFSQRQETAKSPACHSRVASAWNCARLVPVCWCGANAGQILVYVIWGFHFRCRNESV